MDHDRLIISLIKDDLISQKLLLGLAQLGVDASDYYLNLAQTVLTLMGFKSIQRSEVLYKHYAELCMQVIALDIRQPFAIENLAVQMYQELKEIKEAMPGHY